MCTCGAKGQHSAFISLLYSTLAIAMYMISIEVCMCVWGGVCAGCIDCIMNGSPKQLLSFSNPQSLHLHHAPARIGHLYIEVGCPVYGVIEFHAKVSEIN